MRAGAAIDSLRIAQVGCGRSLTLQLCPRAKAGVDQPPGLKLLQMSLIEGRALALVQRRLIPAKPEPREILHRLPGKGSRTAGRVEVLNAQ